MKLKCNARRSGEGAASAITDGLGLTGTEARRGFGEMAAALPGLLNSGQLPDNLSFGCSPDIVFTVNKTPLLA